METNTANRKPFNLKEALAGKPVVNGRGDVAFVTELAVITPHGTSLVSQRINGDVLAYHNYGGTGCINEEFCLYMAAVEVTMWANLYAQHLKGEYIIVQSHKTQESADKDADPSRLGNKAHKITYTE
jgi:hypothetical protein